VGDIVRFFQPVKDIVDHDLQNSWIDSINPVNRFDGLLESIHGLLWTDSRGARGGSHKGNNKGMKTLIK
jgi:hypothetical protein